MKIRDGKLIIRTSDPESTLYHLLHIIKRSSEKLINVDVKKPSLVEVFESLYEKEEENVKHH